MILQLVATGVTIGYISKLNVLPSKYFYLMVAVLAVFFVVTLLLNMSKKKKHIIGKVFGVLVTAGLICVCFYAHHALSMLNTITDEHYDVDNYILAVSKDSNIQSVADMAGKTIGAIDNMNNRTMVEDAVSQIRAAAGSEDIEYKSCKNIAELLETFNSKEVDAILYNENLTEMFDEVIEGFTGTIRTVGEYEVRVVVSDVMEYPTEEETETGEPESETESQTPGWTDNIKVPVYNPAQDPNAPAGGGYIGGDNTRDNSSKGPITNRTFNIYISGQDAYGKVSGRSRSDVNIIMTVDPINKKILLTNTPRDYYVPIPGVTPSNMRDKLTHAGQWGVWTSVATLENVYETRIDYYVKLNFTAFVQIINALGGVEVESPQAFTAGSYKFEKGKITLATGSMALAFARERHAFATGDHQRGKNQMAVINGIINKAMSPVLLTNFTQIINSVKASVQTNMTMDEITSLVKMQLDNPSSWSITQQAAAGSGGQRYCYSLGSYNSTVLPSQSSLDACKAKIYSVLGTSN